ncbi:MFS transporter [Phaeacidiphilus oryzae]|uniref:MFS transporter n=1 Tax=Phaeacidiphilus oryzae TaxID=348818 RepID=UPI000564FD27|nr:MFS transporter [Phaeacidiphilus oryzae]
MVDSPASRPSAPGSLWRNRDFLLLWSGQGAGTLGPQVALVVLPLLALDQLHASSFQVSLLTSLGWLPYLLFSLPAGVLVDRLDQRRLMIACDLGRMLLLASVPLLALAGRLSLGWLYAVVGLAGVLTVVFTVAYRSRLPQIVSPDQLVDANGKLGLCESLAEIAGPGLGGMLTGAVGASRSLLANVLTYALSATTLGLMRSPRKPSPAVPPATRRPPVRAELRQGLDFVRREPVLLRLLLTTSASNFFVTAQGAVAVTFMVRELRAPSSAVGLVFALGSVGGLLSGLLARRIADRFGSARIIWLSMLLPGPLYFLMPLAGHGWGVLWYSVGLSALSANATLFNTASLSYRQRVTPAALLSRVNAVYLWIAYGVIPLGSLTGGVLATAIGLRAALWVCALGMWSGALFVVFSPLRRMRDTPLAAAAGVPEPA